MIDGILFSRNIYDNAQNAPCELRYLRLSSLQTRFRSESLPRPRGYFLARSFCGSGSSASAPPIPRARTLGSRAAAEYVDLELGGSRGDGETVRALRKIFVVLLLIRGNYLVLHSLLETNIFVVLGGLRCYLLIFQDLD